MHKSFRTFFIVLGLLPLQILAQTTGAAGGLSPGQVGSKKVTPATSSKGGSADLPRVFAPTQPRTVYTPFPWKRDITTTIFWIGEEPTENNPTPNSASAWDMKWKENYGGYDNPDRSKRGADYAPVAFVPNQNPFYIALPYQDIMAGAKTKSEARTVIPWFRQLYQRPGKTVLKGVWLAIRYKNKTCYAQWEDVGPFLTDDWKYVFGDARPRNHKNNGAGLDISPAVRDYLGIPGTMKVKCDWRFVRLSEIPPGPWQRYGANNHFVMNRDVQKEDEQQRLAELKRLRDAWFKKNNS